MMGKGGQLGAEGAESPSQWGWARASVACTRPHPESSYLPIFPPPARSLSPTSPVPSPVFTLPLHHPPPAPSPELSHPDFLLHTDREGRLWPAQPPPSVAGRLPLPAPGQPGALCPPVAHLLAFWPHHPLPPPCLSVLGGPCSSLPPFPRREAKRLWPSSSARGDRGRPLVQGLPLHLPCALGVLGGLS